jgi:RHS repeat-associated protein
MHVRELLHHLALAVHIANGNTASSGSATNVYDFENKLVQRGRVSIVYDGDGNRVAKTRSGVTTRFLVDTNNLTGYAQVFEELTNSTAAPQTFAVARKYTYGLDLISQTQSLGTSYYGYDGHGSVRQLTDQAGEVTDTYSYDAFGQLIERTGSTPNLYIYAGEQFDPELGLYYNRARYLDVQHGRFWGMDPSLASNGDAAYLHAYLYADTNPINAIDPTGLYTQAFGYAVERRVQAEYERDFGADDLVSFGGWTRLGRPSNRAPYSLKPDILDRRDLRGDFSPGRIWLEVKPLSVSGVFRAQVSWTLYSSTLSAFQIFPDYDWLADGRVFTVENQPTFVFNLGGILFYTTSQKDFETFQEALRVFGSTVGAATIGAAAGSAVNALVKTLPQVPGISGGAEVIDISTKAAFATRASDAQSKVDTAVSEILAVSGF